MYKAKLNAFYLTCWLMDQHQAAQQSRKGQGEHGNVCVTVSSQQLQQERQGRRQAGWGAVAFELQEILAANEKRKKSEWIPVFREGF